MTQDQWSSIEAYFDSLSEVPTHERAARLAAIKDPIVRDEVESLLRNSVGGGETVSGVIGIAAAHIVDHDRRIGPYRVTRRLGQGGQGTVFEAVRDDGTFDQRVAIKIVKWDVDSTYARDRFRRERQLLAGLSHPYIARLLDGGETEDGAPYLVMEFVEGEPLTTPASNWTLQRKLEVFLEIADAVGYAHRNLIIHRDLKPANILVTSDGHPKLLDFGVAKLLDADADVTATVAQAMTPAYASPEQVLGRPIGTASDVYSLGVVLYELVTGRMPYQIATMTAISIERAVCETDPPPARVSEDIDNILSMALRKEPERRYAGVHELAEDIKRSMSNLPVRARPDTIRYRTSKFARRNRWPIGAAAMLAVALTGGVVASQYQARLAQQRFEQVRRLAHSFVFDFDDDIARLAGSTAVREKMVRMALEYLDNLSKSAGSDVGLQKELAAAYQKVGDVQGFPTKPSLGHTAEAVVSYRKASEIHEKIAARHGSYWRELGRFYNDFAGLLRFLHDYAGASQMAEVALRSEQQLAREKPDDEAAQIRLARAWFLVGDIDEDRGYNVEALEKVRSGDAIAQAILKRWRDVKALEIAQSGRERLGTCASANGFLRESLLAFDDAETLLTEMLVAEPQNPKFHRSEAVLAQFRAGTYDDDSSPSFEDPRECLRYSQLYLDAARKMVALDPANASAKFSLAIALFRISFPMKSVDPPGAVEAARESVRMFDQQIDASAGKPNFLLVSRRARAMRRLAEALQADGRVDEARKQAEEALAEQRKMAAHDAGDREESHLLVLALITAGRFEEAAEKAAAMYKKAPRDLPAALILARAREAAAAYFRKMGDEPRAAQAAESARAIWREFPVQNDYVSRKRSAPADSITNPSRTANRRAP